MPQAFDRTPMDDISSDVRPEPLWFRFKVELIVLTLLGSVTALQVFYRDEFTAIVEPVIGRITLLIAASVGAALPGIIYKGGEWYTKLGSGRHFRTQERAFVLFLAETGIAVGIAFGLQRFLMAALPQFLDYIWLVFLEWLLLVYVWFTRMKRYSFPGFYVIGTNMLIAAFGYIIYRFA